MNPSDNDAKPAVTDVIIRVRDLHKSFDGVHAVRGLSFDVPRGAVVGFIGANGSGKTTTMRIIATLDLPDAGTIAVDGWDAVEHPREVRKRVGWMPDSYGSYTYVSVLDYLDFHARACGYRGEERERRVHEVMEFADLVPLADRPMNGLSKGMAQRLCFGRALLQQPPILVLDEPAAGLDPKARIEFKNLVQILARRGTTIFISSHILSELGETCDSLIFIDQGRLVHHGTADSLQRDNGAVSVIEIQVQGSETPLLEWLSVNQGWLVVARSKGSVRAEFASNDLGDVAAQLRRMIQDGLPIIDFHKQERRLEEVFVDVLKRNAAGRSEPPPLPGRQ